MHIAPFLVIEPFTIISQSLNRRAVKKVVKMDKCTWCRYMHEDMYPVGQLCAQIPAILKVLTFDITSRA